MLLAYLDESGDEQPLRTPEDPPVLVIAGVVVDHERVMNLVWQFLQLKKRYSPSLLKDDVQLSDLIRFEVKGSDLRKDVRSATRRNRRRALGFLDAVLKLLEEERALIIGEVYIKGEKPLSRWVYPQAVAKIAAGFEHQLQAAGTQGLIIMDARTKVKNTPSVHRLTTTRFKSGGNPVPHLVESPTFGHSDAHVILQIADIVASALIFPMACVGYCNTLIRNVHLNDEYAVLRTRYGQKLNGLQYRYTTADTGRRVGSLRVIDRLNGQPSRALYDDAAAFDLNALARFQIANGGQ
ncbi:DUF3800 domain-containing protein [Mycolicibacter arupensis]|uniref:DUF3800 domain-containing protein n=1 Tax=Mycolicibacter arupensis TaxID=342002 RepID=A0ABX3RJ04_9MYCO|nr:DUF3800 domain-containing protein [Mycolicibacter arupensis]MCV7274127.1 DUF3800 domain-containing protein [Mycolicibacter arupensis]OQZ94093.1 hypothetical protein BST15_17235 [Mycolicibacter arupensis]